MALGTSTMHVKLLAAGPGWCVREMTCTAGPRDRPFEETHGGVSLGAVLQGTFRYRSVQGSALLAPGSILLGNPGQCFECGHEHGMGDRCIALHLAPEYWEDVVAGVPGARRATFRLPCLPPDAALTRALAALESSRGRDAGELEEALLEVASSVARAENEAHASVQSPSTRDQRRIATALRRIESAAHELEPGLLGVGRLARDCGMTPYHFLRTFRAIVGMTPHQYLIQRRLQRAATLLLTSDERIADVAYAAGFNDLSSFNHRFRRTLGQSPGRYRQAARAPKPGRKRASSR